MISASDEFSSITWEEAPSIGSKTNPDQKPLNPGVQPQNVPDFLKALDRWVVWKWEWRGKKWAKPPLQTNGEYAASNRPQTWTTFEDALNNHRSGAFDGIGVILPDGVSGVDLDNMVDPQTREVNSQGLQALAIMGDTYAEFSPSGTGLKMLAGGVLNSKLKKIDEKRGLELYDGSDTNRYFTITGDIVPGRTKITGQREGLHFLQTLLSGPVEAREGRASDVPFSEVAEALRYVPAEKAESYSEWCAVGMAIKSTSDSEEAFQAWVEWSRKASSFVSEEDCRGKWDSFRRTEGKMLTSSYIVHAAKAGGWRPRKYRSGAISGAALCQKKIVRSYIIEDVMVDREPMIVGGASKSLKTTVTTDLAVSIATGTPFLGKFRVPRPRSVLFISGESGEATTQETIMTILKARGLKPEDLVNLHISFKLPKLDDDGDVQDLLQELQELAIDIVIIDPLYRSLRAGDDASNIFAMGEKLELIAEQIHAAGVTPILLHHFRKMGKSWHEPPELEDLSQSGLSEFGRQFFLLKRALQYEMDGIHELWFKWGGSAGHQGQGMLHIDTGTRERGLVYDCEFMSPNEWKARQKDKKQEAKMEASTDLEASIVLCLTQHPGATKRQIITQVGGSRTVLDATLDLMEELGTIERRKGPNRSVLHFVGYGDSDLL